MARASRATWLQPVLLAACIALAQAACMASSSTVPATRPIVLDSFDDSLEWTAAPSDGVSMQIASDSGHRGRAMRVDVDFHGGGGYAIVSRSLPLDLPENYAFTLWIRGDIQPQNLEFKLVDSTGDNVWWMNRRDFHFPERWTQLTFRRRQIEFAWGPLGGGELRHVAAIELAITAGSGGRGSVWLDEFVLEPREPVVPYTGTPVASASSSAAGSTPQAVVDTASPTGWRSAADGPQWLSLDFGRNRELGGVTIVWDSLDHATDYDVQRSANGVDWQTIYTVSGGDGGSDPIYLPETEARWLRIAMVRSARGRGYAMHSIIVHPLAWAASLNSFYAALAHDAPRGDYPRAITDSVMSYWTIVGAPADEREALVSEDGAVEVRKGGFSIEPFLRLEDGRFLGWADVRSSQTLVDSALPIPSVVWSTADSLSLTTTAFVAGGPDSAVLWLRYRVRNEAAAPQRVALYSAIRPFQVNPPMQFLNTPGGAGDIRTISVSDGTIRVNGGPSAGGDEVVAVTRPDAAGAASFDAGGVVSGLRSGVLPPDSAAVDTLGRAAAVLGWALDVPAHGDREVVLAAPLDATQTAAVPKTPPGAARPPGTVTAPSSARQPGANLSAEAAAAIAEREQARTAAAWRARLNRVTVTLPGDAADIGRSLASTVAYILINQDGPGIQPGSRSYERSWIRDGALTSTALLQMGQADMVRPFIEWYAGFQYPNGKIPCCVDHRGADPVPENDSHGEFIYLVAEYVRFTGDTTLARSMWPHVVGAVSYVDSLRRSRMTARYRSVDSLRAYYGLMPQSISHEGYSAKPMHSYWDDLFTLRGLKDAAWLARLVGDADSSTRYDALRDEFQRDLVESYRRAMAKYGIDYLPGAVELGDFDPTSTTIAVSPVGVGAALPDSALRRTFERYWEEFVARRDGAKPWDNYTPYEWRVVGTMVRIDQPARAHAIADWFMGHQRPPGWNQWAEVVWKDPRTPRFIGDMPHTWVGSDFIRSVLDFFAYTRESDSSVVVGAAVPSAWATRGAGVSVKHMRTEYGQLDLRWTPAAGGALLAIGGDLRVPVGGIVVRAPYDVTPRRATVNGRRESLTADGSMVLRALPAEVRWWW